MKKIIEVLISPTGETRIETTGYTGSACQDATRRLQQALGRQTAEVLKPEFHQSLTNPQQLEERH